MRALYTFDSSILETWNPASAWWMGLLYGDGCVSARQKTYAVSIAGTELTVRRWLNVIRSDVPVRQHSMSLRTFEGVISSKKLYEFLRDSYGITSPKSASLHWPSSLPDNLTSHFIRGLWDSDGSLAERGKYACARYRSSSIEFVDDVRDALCRFADARFMRGSIQRKPGSLPSACLAYVGHSSYAVTDFLYKNAPEHLRNEDRYEAYLRHCEIRKAWRPRKYKSLSGILGVNFHRASKLWQAKIYQQGQTICIGYFHCKEKAAEARRAFLEK